MPTTSRGYTYPASTDHTRIWEHIQTLAEDINDDVAALVTASSSAVDATSRTTTSTTFGQLTPSLVLGVAFVAPTSGIVMVHYAVDQDCSGGAGSFSESCPAIKTGAVVGSGASVLAAAHDRAVIAYDGVQMRMGSHMLLAGLTPGSSYNAYFEHATSAATTGTFRWRQITAVPLAA